MQTIGDRMKQNYEIPSRHKLLRRTPVIIRIDGKAFHSFTRGMEKPFDRLLIENMISTAQVTGSEMQGFKAGYAQSDEVSFLLTDYDNLQTEAWFGYVKSKVETITASIMTVVFSKCIQSPSCSNNAFFDARAFNVPREEVSNYFLWRMLDWERNSLQMYARSIFSANQLHKKNSSDIHEMLHSVGKNWAVDLDAQLKNGTWFFSDDTIRTDIKPAYGEINNVLGQFVYDNPNP